jgi:hypothetical protein
MPYFLEVISFDTLHHDGAAFGASANFGRTPKPSALFDVIGRLNGCVRYVFLFREVY